MVRRRSELESRLNPKARFLNVALALIWEEGDLFQFKIDHSILSLLKRVGFNLSWNACLDQFEATG